ncbi:MAG: hypothetical protein C0623_12370 [Desulfuromonas sp.]|nr:MAG: hypothetical protein C0623_12370 [Desulfuromonas sp.]
MIEEVGHVIELKDKAVAVVLCQKSSFCENCAAEGVCHVGEDNSSKAVEVHNRLNAGIGDRVRIATTTRSFLQSSFLLYIVPLVCLVVGAIAGQLLAENLISGSDPDLLAAISGTTFMTASFIALRFASRYLTKEEYMPVIVEIVDAQSSG